MYNVRSVKYSSSSMLHNAFQNYNEIDRAFSVQLGIIIHLLIFVEIPPKFRYVLIIQQCIL